MSPVHASGINGAIPETYLEDLPGYDGDGTPHRAHGYAVESYNRLRRDFTAAGMGDLIPTDGYSCYRTLDDQQHMNDIGLTTMPPGQSIHGEALAVDFEDLGGFGSPRYAWLAANAGRYGWYQPSWALANGSLPEYWHWEYDEDMDQYPEPINPTVEDDPMPVFIYTSGTNTWWLYDGYRKRQLAPGEPQELVDLGIVRPGPGGPGTVPAPKWLPNSRVDAIPNA